VGVGDGGDVAGIGDGAHLFYPNTLYAAVRYDVDLTVVVADNRNYRILKDNMLSLFGGEEDYDFVKMDFEPPVDIATNAETYGASGWMVDDPGPSKLRSRKPSTSRDRRSSMCSYPTESTETETLAEHRRWYFSNPNRIKDTAKYLRVFLQ
jgi:TPP-dependent trihydroxycyclohexane-1,2-dione (THcHDO) dehydratase